MSSATRAAVPASPHRARALELAAEAQHRNSPNPMVGAVIVNRGEVVGEGLHRQAGGPHAEIEALRAAGEQARGATVYVTLEPCCHEGRTAPCADALIAAGVTRVVAAMEDPDPRVRGRGLRRLRDAEVEVEVGGGARPAAELNPGGLGARRNDRPFAALKFAASLDGQIATGA